MADHNTITNNSESDVPASFNLSEADELRVRGLLTAKAEALRKRLPEAIGNLPLDLNLMLYSYAADPYSYLKSDSEELTAAVSALNNWKKEAMWYLDLNMQLNLGVLATYLQGIVDLIPSAEERSDMSRRIREDDFIISSDAPLDFSERIQMVQALDSNHRAALLDLLRWSRFNDPASERKPSIKTSVPPSEKTESAVSSGSFTDIKNILLSRSSTISGPVKLAVNEEDIRAFFASGTPITTSDFGAKFGPKMTTPADKAAFYDMVTRLTKVRKAGGKRLVVLNQFARAAGENENEGIVDLIPSAAERSEMSRRIREDDYIISSDAPLDFSERIQIIQALDSNHRAALLDMLSWSRFNLPPVAAAALLNPDTK